MTKILVVDDGKDMESLFRQIFRKEIRTGALELFFAFSAAEALAHLEANGVTALHTILIDVDLPDMNGLELLRHIKQRFPGPKVAIITGYGNTENRKKAQEYDCDNYLIKPLDFADLKRKILSAL